MKVIKNPEFFKIGEDRTVTVSVTFDVSKKANDAVILRNAEEAIDYFEANGVHKSWTRNITIK